MDQIVSRTKKHEYRSYLIPSTVRRMCPRQILKYIAVISRGKSPSEIDLEDGLGADFNAGLQGPSVCAYEIRELYQLRQPIPLAEMQQKYRVTFPQRYIYVPDGMAKDIELENQTRLF
ncbi:hypothetical protein H2248_006902 [Termitomyces sp. 'cryptogamus']|nr:hypothetical protein H2248_006902 [Termitomyces sp. 'cryptogamus']